MPGTFSAKVIAGKIEARHSPHIPARINKCDNRWYIIATIRQIVICDVELANDLVVFETKCQSHAATSKEAIRADVKLRQRPVVGLDISKE
jgi:hypothetical protein